MSDKPVTAAISRGWRLWLVMLLLLLVALGITGRMLGLYITEQDFLQGQGEARTVRVIQAPAHRGIIADRHGEPLAVSAPVATIWADPAKMNLEHASMGKMAALLQMSRPVLLRKLSENRERRFIYLKRQVTPELASQVLALAIPGVHIDREYKRFYPAGEVTTHLVGFTDLDGKGQEGLELSFEDWLHAEPGKQMVMKDRLGRTIKHIRELSPAQNGSDMQLTIDLRLQYLAYRELKAAVQTHKADGGSLVMLDAATGEILAMVNQPSYNPNDPAQRIPSLLRNRALTDVFEPGSTMKPLTVAAALMSGKYRPETVVHTAPGYIRVKGNTIRDHRNYGDLDLTGIITKSSNVGVTKLALSMDPGAVVNLMRNVGLGQATTLGYPGESSGVLPYLADKQVVERATMSYGYGLSVTPLQLAQSYLALANDGVMTPPSLIRQSEANTGVRVMPTDVARNVRAMMETVISASGTGRRAAVPGYRVAGKTGTVHKVGSGGYIDDQYISVFAGIAPASNPRLVTVVMVDNPKGQEYYGGEVAAPVFSRTLSGALRLLNVPPDDWPKPTGQVVQR
ncbi:peptidoglycan D,D-transpeptidase FtsI family protein [Pontibacter sp. JAM-7]|uniref:peptidoglycan D,D-transpeptidase FtsI family protein n=1 Tax=Pontibacter sp. JAM-7 TaxID=3366581 RepID=UPI003AF6035B